MLAARHLAARSATATTNSLAARCRSPALRTQQHTTAHAYCKLFPLPSVLASAPIPSALQVSFRATVAYSASGPPVNASPRNGARETPYVLKALAAAAVRAVRVLRGTLHAPGQCALTRQRASGRTARPRGLDTSVTRQVSIFHRKLDHSACYCCAGVPSTRIGIGRLHSAFRPWSRRLRVALVPSFLASSPTLS